jgi:hypothetical protein
MAMARVVFPSPGRSSIRRCPFEKNVRRESRKGVSFPWRYPEEKSMIRVIFSLAAISPCDEGNVDCLPERSVPMLLLYTYYHFEIFSVY